MSVLIADPEEVHFSHPSSMQEYLSTNSGDFLLWKDESTSAAGKNYLAYKNGIAVSVGARKCTVVSLTNGESRKFYQATHLQGPCNGFKHLALVYNKSLVACMSFAMPSNCRSANDAFMLQRYASLGAVPGGAARLLAEFRSVYTGAIRTFSDHRYASGNLYAKLGFEAVRELAPDYRYWRADVGWAPKNRKQRRHLLLEGGVGTTERELADSLGYTRQYDLGKTCWEL